MSLPGQGQRSCSCSGVSAAPQQADGPRPNQFVCSVPRADIGWHEVGRVGFDRTQSPQRGTSSDRDGRPPNPEFAASKVNLALARGVNRFMPSCVDTSVLSTTAKRPAGVPLPSDPPYPSPPRTARISAIEAPRRFRVVPARPTALPNQPRFGVPMIVRLGDGSNQATG